MYTPEQVAASMVEKFEELFAIGSIASEAEKEAFYAAVRDRFSSRLPYLEGVVSLMEILFNSKQRFFPNVPELPDDQKAAVILMNLTGAMNTLRVSKKSVVKKVRKMVEHPNNVALPIHAFLNEI